MVVFSECLYVSSSLRSISLDTARIHCCMFPSSSFESSHHKFFEEFPPNNMDSINESVLECKRDLKEAYIYGSVGILVISLLSLVGALVIPCLRKGSRDCWMQIFVALAISTMVGDALLHLIPEVHFILSLPQRLRIHIHKMKRKDDLINVMI